MLTEKQEKNVNSSIFWGGKKETTHGKNGKTNYLGDLS